MSSPKLEYLLAVVADILGLEAIGAEDNFFGLGGDSLDALSLLAALENQFGCEIDIALLFESTTFEELARGLPEGSVEGS